MKKRVKRWNCVCVGIISFCLLVLPNSSFGNPSIGVDKKKLETRAKELTNPTDFPLITAEPIFLERYGQGMGLEEIAWTLLFPASGRVRFVQTIPRFGKLKVHYQTLPWESYDTDHATIYAYDKEMLNLSISLVEEAFADFSKRFEITSFGERIRIYVFKDRRDFEQTNMFPGLVPEGLGGFTGTEHKRHNKVVFPFEGDKQEFFHVGRHEIAHRFNLEQYYRISGKDVNQGFLGRPQEFLPLWFIEGMAENASRRWSARSEQIARDGYYNHFLSLGAEPYFAGTILMYVVGNLVVNYVEDNFSRDVLNQIIDDTAREMSFEENLQKNLGLSPEELVGKAIQDFGSRLEKNNQNESEVVTQGKVLGARGRFFVYGKFEGLRSKLYLARLLPPEAAKEKKDPDFIETEFASDQRSKNESLHFFASSVAINDKQIAYVIRNNESDVLRVLSYSYSFPEPPKAFEKYGEDRLAVRRPLPDKGRLRTGTEREFRFPGIISIHSPVFVGKAKIAFIGVKEGFANLFLSDLETGTARPLTKDTNNYRGLDYSPERNELVFARESNLRTDNPNKCDFNYDLYVLKLEKPYELRQITNTVADETYPRFIDKGKRIVFESDQDGTYNLYVYDFDAERILKVTDERIAAHHPQVLFGNRIIFNSFALLQPQIRLGAVPDTPEMIAKDIQRDFEKSSLKRIPKPQRNIGLLGNLYFEKGKMFVESSGKRHRTKRMLVEEETLYLEAEVEHGGKTAIFNYDYPPLEASVLGLYRSDEKIKNFLDDFRDRYTVLWEGLTEDQKYIFLVTNNRLSFPNEILARKHPLTLYIYSVPRHRVWRIVNIEINSPREFLEIRFLTAGRFLIVGRDSETVLYSLWSSKQTSIESVFIGPRDEGELKEYNISPSGKFIAGIVRIDNLFRDDKEIVYLYNAETEKRIKIAEEEKISHLRWNEEGHLLWQGEKDGDDVWRFYVLEPTSLTKKHFAVKRTETENVVSFEANRNDNFVLKLINKDEVYIDIDEVGFDDETGFDRSGFYRTRPRTETKTVVPKPLDNPKKERLYIGELLEVESTPQKRVMGLRRLLPEYHTFESIRLDNGKLLFAAKNMWTENLFLYRIAENVLKIGTMVKEAEIDDSLRFIALYEGTDLWLLTVKGNKIVKAARWRNIAGFDIGNGNLVYSAWNGKEYNIFLMSLEERKFEFAAKTEANEILPRFKEDGTIEFLKEAEPKPRTIGSLKFVEPRFEERRVRQKTISNAPFDTHGGFALGGIIVGGKGNIAGFLVADVVSKDVFEDSLLALSYFGNIRTFNLGSVTYLHFPSGFGLRSYIHELERDLISGAEYLRLFPFSRYMRVSISTGYEFQDLTRYPDFVGKNHLLKVGSEFSYDTSIFELHGPKTGFRFYTGGNVGYSITENTLSNADLNLALRKHFYLGKMITFAARIDAGTSHGLSPTWFVDGGNMTMRGVPLFSRIGNNFAITGIDLRLDMFEVAGVIWREPIMPLSIFTASPRVEVGWYADTGANWYYNLLRGNEELENRLPFRLEWSTGPFLNIPYIPLSMIVRFNWAVSGNVTGWNLWLGMNW